MLLHHIWVVSALTLQSQSTLRCKFQRIKDTWIDFKEGHDVGARRFQDYTQCEKWCCQVEQCRHYTFNHDKHCYLRSSDPYTVGKQHDAGVHSGIKSSANQDDDDTIDVVADDQELDNDQPKQDPLPRKSAVGFCSSLDGPYCMSINGLEAPPEVLEPKFNTQSKMPLEIENIVRQLKESFGKNNKRNEGVQGTFKVHGQTTVSGGQASIDITPGEWTMRPGDGNWISVGITGSITPTSNSSTTLNGRILIDGVAEDSCKPFKIRKLQSDTPERKHLRYQVVGAGSKQVNGEYLLNGSSVDGSPQYTKLGEGVYSMLHFPSIEASPEDTVPEAWYLTDLGVAGVAGDGDDLDYYRIASASHGGAVPSTGWKKDSAGVNPSPHISVVQPEGGYAYLEGEWKGYYECNGATTQLNLTLHCLEGSPAGRKSSKWSSCSKIHGSFQFGTGQKIYRAQSNKKPMQNTTVFKVVSQSNVAKGMKESIPYGSAEFGPSLDSVVDLNASLVPAVPFDGCKPLVNKAAVRGGVVLVERGGCMFVDKAKAAQDAGAALVVIVNSENMVMNMSTDELDEIGGTIQIPAILVSKSSGASLKKAAQIVSRQPGAEKVSVGVRRELRASASNTLQQVLNAFGGVQGSVQVAAVNGEQMMDGIRTFSTSSSDVSSEIMQALVNQMQASGNGASELLNGLDAQVVLITEDGQQVMNLDGDIKEYDGDSESEVEDAG